MDSHAKKLQHQIQAEALHDSTIEQTHSTKTYAKVEDLLRDDAAQTPLPRAVEERLRRSLASSQSPRHPWWKRLFGR